MDLIPNDIVLDVFRCLPGEQLSKFKEVCKTWILLIERGYKFLPLHMVSYVNIYDDIQSQTDYDNCCCYGISRMIEEEELKFMHDGKEHSQLVRHYKDVDSDAEPLDIFRRCLISNLSINIGDETGIKNTYALAKINDGIIYAKEFHYQSSLDKILKKDENFLKIFDVDSANFFISISSLKLIAENPSLMHMKSKWMKIEITESLVDQNILQNLFDFIFYEENSTKRKIIFTDLNHASFLKEFYQVQLEYKKELFPWVEDMKQLGIWYIKTEKDKEDEWKMYEKVRQDGWSLRVSWSLSQGSSRYISLYRLTWKFDIFKRE